VTDDGVGASAIADGSERDRVVSRHARSSSISTFSALRSDALAFVTKRKPASLPAIVFAASSRAPGS